MDTNQIQQTYKSGLLFLNQGRLKDAFAKIELLIKEAQDGFLSDRFENLQTNYRYMLQYYIDGVEDPERKSVYNKLIAKLFLLSSDAFENLFLQNSTNYEYSKKRYFSHLRKYSNLSDLFNRLQNIHSQLELFSTEEGLPDDKFIEIRKEYEELFYEIFGLFWFSTYLNKEEVDFFNQLINKDYPGILEKSLAVSALTLNLWRFFDEKKLMLLFDCCESDNQYIKQRALVGLCFVLAKYNSFLAYFPIIRNRLVLISDNEHTLENFRNIIMQIIASTETDKISKKLQEEILPEISKLSNKFKSKEDLEGLLHSDDWEEGNPQWEEMIEESGMSEKLKEFADLQMEGADVYMSTFSLLKSFPFFSEIQNWFLPFDLNYSSIYDLFEKKEKSTFSDFINSQIMCNSDLYSFCLSISQMPSSQREMLKQSLKMESEQLSELKKDEVLLNPDVHAKNISKQYVQDLFRFFKLFTKRDDFENMFESALMMHKTCLFDILSSNSDLRRSIAEYYFSKKLYVQSLELFIEEQKTDGANAALSQKIAYSYQQLSQLSKALEVYIKADIIQPDDIWTVKKIALCYRLQGQFDKALESYKHADFLNPNNFAIQMQIAFCYFNLKQYKETLQIYFRLEAADEDNIRIHRAISWTMFISKNTEQAEYYMKKILSNAPLEQDYLNAGHIAWSLGKIREATTYYTKCWEMQENNWNLFLEKFNSDILHLENNGIAKDEIPLMLDELRYIIQDKEK